MPPGFTAVSSIAQLLAIGNNLNGKYVLTADIDLSDSRNWNNGAGFAPIGGDVDFEFRGTFDGGGHKITGLYINRPAEAYVGLFRFTVGATIKDIYLEGNDITGQRYVGGIVGQAGGSTITNSYASGNVSSSEHTAGGLVGKNWQSTITNSGATGTVSGKNNIGGLVGDSASGSTITNSYSTGTVSGDSGVGGLVSSSSYSTITTSYATGDVNGTGGRIGGLVGQNDGASITNSYATGDISGGGAGGLVGKTYGTSSISNSYATGNVSSSNGGGLLGSAATGSITITNSYTTGSVSSGFGLVGYVYNENVINTANSGWYDNPNDGAASAGASVTYTETNPGAFYNPAHGVYAQGGANPWDFTNVWQANANGFPSLRK